MRIGDDLKYGTTTLLSIAFILLSEGGYYFLILPVLLAANLANLFWGEFTAEEIKEELTRFYCSKSVIVIKRINAIFLLGMVAWAIGFVDRSSQSLAYLLGFALCVGCLSGCFIVTLAHDLLHSRRQTDRVLSAFLLAASCIPHLAADHIFGHHCNIGLKKDFNTSKINQSFYAYFILLAIDRIRQSYFLQFGLPTYIRKKIFLLNLKMLGLFVGILMLIFLFTLNPGISISFFFLQGFVAYFLYELINYIQHYGLVRRQENQRITLGLSWNCYYKYTNYILHMLPLHSLHHLPGCGRNIEVKSLKDGPRMPYLYFVMVLMALIPPLWFYKMNVAAQKINNKPYVV